MAEGGGISGGDLSAIAVAHQLLDPTWRVGGKMTGAEQILAERNRQIEDEKWTPEHDDQHTDHSLIEAAISYATIGSMSKIWWSWPPSWSHEHLKREGVFIPSDRDLVKAGALIAAELDRRARARLR